MAQITAQDFLLVVFTLLAAISLAYLALVWFSERNMPPCPWRHRWPIIGQLPLLREDLHLLYTELAQRYGDVFMLRVGSWRVVVANGPAAIKEALVSKSIDFAGRVPTPVGDIFSNNGRSIIRGSYGPLVRLHRKIFIQATREFLEKSKCEGVLEHEIREVLKAFKTTAQKEFDPEDSVRLAVFNVLSYMVFGNHFQGSEEDCQYLSSIITKFNSRQPLLATYIPWMPWLKYLRPSLLDKMRALKKKLYDGIYTRNLQWHKETFDPAVTRDFTDALIRASKQAEEEDSSNAQYLTDDDTVNCLSNVIGAGFDTVTSALLWGVLFLAQHPEHQTRAQEELDEVVGSDRLPRIQDKEKLNFVHAIYMETLRIGNVAALALPHMTLRDTTLQGYAVPRDTMVIVNLWSLHMNKELWPEPDVFNPYRFLDDEGRFTGDFTGWLPFSAGRRVCAGEIVAKTEVFLFLAAILQSFTVRLPPGQTADVKGILGVTYSPRPYQLIAEPR